MKLCQEIIEFLVGIVVVTTVSILKIVNVPYFFPKLYTCWNSN